jgi:hypothetical protein
MTRRVEPQPLSNHSVLWEGSLNFTQKKRIKGKTIKTYREWWSDCGNYRITWRNEVSGVEVDPGFFACVKCVVSDQDCTEYIGFAHRRGLNRTLKAAIKQCEGGKKAWDRFLRISGRAKVTQFRRLRAETMVGVGKNRYSAFTDIPVWVIEEADERLLKILCPKETDPEGEQEFDDEPEAD